jgi:hypothetical protein
MRLLIHSAVVCLFVLSAAATTRVAGLSITGTITDPSGAPLPGVSVELVSDAKVVATVTTDARGAFEFKNVARRRYELRARLNGFKALRTRAIVVGTSSPPPLRLTLQMGSVSESVTVDAKTVLAQAPAPPAALFAAARVDGAVGSAAAAISDFNTEAYDRIEDNHSGGLPTSPLSTFSSMSTPPRTRTSGDSRSRNAAAGDAVRVEELINYFHFDYATSTEHAPFGLRRESRVPVEREAPSSPLGMQAKRLPEGRPRRGIWCSSWMCPVR